MTSPRNRPAVRSRVGSTPPSSASPTRRMAVGLCVLTITVGASLSAAAGAEVPTSTATGPVTAALAVAGSLGTLTATQTRIPGLPGVVNSVATPVAVDGSLVIGNAETDHRYPAATHAFVYDAAAPVPVTQDLGTLAGPGTPEDAATGVSTAVDVDDGVVVGDTVGPYGSGHAFAYDTRAAAPRMQDLGIMVDDEAEGGGYSHVAAVDGGLVVGTGTIYHGRSGPFVYDLSAAVPRMVNISNDRTGVATAVDDGLVVGYLTNSIGHDVQAFFYDRSAAVRTLVTIGGSLDSVATAVHGTTIVGYTRSASDVRRMFSYDIAAANPRMVDLGPLTGQDAAVAGVSGGAAGTGTAAGTSADQPFIVTVGAAVRRYLGGLGGTSRLGPGGYHVTANASASAIDADLVVGRAARAGDNRYRAFVYDVSAPAPRMMNLPTLNPDAKSQATAVSRAAGLVVGQSNGAGALWRLREATGPSFSFARRTTTPSTSEDARSASFTVYRTGDTAPAATVSYVLRGVTTGVADVRAGAGTVRFAAGQTRATFTVSILDDWTPEKREIAMVRLRTPSAGGVIGTPDTAGIRIAASDQRLDALIATGSVDRPGAAYVGEWIHNSSGAGQTRLLTASARSRVTRSFWVKVYNRTNAYNTFTLRGSPAVPGTTVRYLYAPIVWPKYPVPVDVTAQMRSGSGYKVGLVGRRDSVTSNDPGTFTRIRVDVTAWGSARVGSRATAVLTSTWLGDVNSQDVVHADVVIGRR